LAAQTYTALHVIKRALRLLNATASGENIDPDEAADGLAVLNEMLESWSAERLLVFNIQRLIFNLVNGVQTYKMGQDGVGVNDFNTPRPAKITRVSVISLANAALPLELQMQYTTDEKIWQEVRVKAIQSSLPRVCYDDCAMPNRNLNYYPVPTSVYATQTAIYPWSALAAFPDLVTPLTFPPGYARAIALSLAEELQPEFGGQLSPMVVQKAMKARQTLRAMNAPSMNRETDPVLLDTKSGTYNWLTDDAELD
jgi:hypothetical protein